MINKRLFEISYLFGCAHDVEIQTLVDCFFSAFQLVWSFWQDTRTSRSFRFRLLVNFISQDSLRDLCQEPLFIFLDHFWQVLNFLWLELFSLLLSLSSSFKFVQNQARDDIWLTLDWLRFIFSNKFVLVHVFWASKRDDSIERDSHWFFQNILTLKTFSE